MTQNKTFMEICSFLLIWVNIKNLQTRGVKHGNQTLFYNFYEKVLRICMLYILFLHGVIHNNLLNKYQ